MVTPATYSATHGAIAPAAAACGSSFAATAEPAGTSKQTIPLHDSLDHSAATSMLREASYVKGESGSPGTMLMIPAPAAGKPAPSALEKFEVIVVNEMGDPTTHTVTKHPDGRWTNGAKGRVFENFHQLQFYLLEGMVSLLGDGCTGIQFFTEKQWAIVADQLKSADEGTYVCIAHQPMMVMPAPYEHIDAPVSRNILMWKGPEEVKLAYFHCKRDFTPGHPPMYTWENGGPVCDRLESEHVGAAAEGGGSSGATGECPSPPPSHRAKEVASALTLESLIYLKVAASCTEGTRPAALELTP